MLKPTVINILLFWFAKYIAFYVLMMFKNNNYALIGLDNLKTGEDWFYYLWIFLFLPVVCMVVFSTPVYFSFRVKSLIYFVLIIAAILVTEYLFYTWSASQVNLMNGIYNGIISLLFLVLFFYRHISSFYQQNTQ